MKHLRGGTVEVDSLSEFEERWASGPASISGWRVRGVDLGDQTSRLSRVGVAGALFLGCDLDHTTAADLVRRGALVFNDLPGVPVDVYRTRLYTAAELFGTGDYRDSLDARAYAWASCGEDPELAQTLHDHAIDRALEEWIAHRQLVGVMGGHALARGSSEYAFAARLGHALGQSCVVTTGGGPGAMEAANLGGRLAQLPLDALEPALHRLGQAPSFTPDVGVWARAAFDVLADQSSSEAPGGSDTLGIPTWHYGHEPPNPFATAIAKYFRNATREAILLEICDRGIVFLPGAAGTLQEVFQDACENYYADASAVAPMVLVGREHWTETVPAWPLLKSLARGREMEAHIHLVDTVEEAAAIVVGT